MAFKTMAGIAGALCAFSITAAAAATPSAASLDASWSFMQQQMPGAPRTLLDDACKEGTVLIYYGTWVDAQEAQIKGFQQRFPCIDVQQYTADTGARRERWLDETRAGRYLADIIQDTDPNFLNEQAASGALLKYQISNDPSFPAAAKDPGYWYSMRVGLIGIAWNTDRVTDDEAKRLTTWQGVTDPIWKGRAGVVDPTPGGIVYFPWYVWTQLYGTDFIQKIGALQPRVIAAIDPAAAALASGDIDVLLDASETGLLPLIQKGAPIRWSLPSPGIGAMTGQGIPLHAPHPSAAELYQEYTFTVEGYGLWSAIGGAPARTGFKDQRPVAQNDWYKLPSTFYPLDTAAAQKARSDIIDAFHKYVGGAR